MARALVPAQHDVSVALVGGEVVSVHVLARQRARSLLSSLKSVDCQLDHGLIEVLGSAWFVQRLRACEKLAGYRIALPRRQVHVSGQLVAEVCGHRCCAFRVLLVIHRQPYASQVVTHFSQQALHGEISVAAQPEVEVVAQRGLLEKIGHDGAVVHELGKSRQVLHVMRLVVAIQEFAVPEERALDNDLRRVHQRANELRLEVLLAQLGDRGIAEVDRTLHHLLENAV